jgi:NADH:ubiquinone oxidoreductase subunit F (NADH-binding)
VSSEETALISQAHGRLARPLSKRDLYVRGGRDSSGRRVRPTVVLNAETAWRIAQVADHGAAWFRSFGTPDEPGPRLASVVGYVARPQVVSSEAGTLLASLIELAGAPPAPGAVLLNGLGGVFLTADQAARAVWSADGLAAVGASIGPGILEVVDPRSCPLELVTRYLGYAAGETAGQCGPCMFGVPTLSAEWAALVHSPTRQRRDRVLAHVSLLPGRGACRFPDGVARFAGSALRVFDRHLREHAQGRCTGRPVTEWGAHRASA